MHFAILLSLFSSWIVLSYLLVVFAKSISPPFISVLYLTLPCKRGLVPRTHSLYAIQPYISSPSYHYSIPRFCTLYSINLFLSMGTVLLIAFSSSFLPDASHSSSPFNSLVGTTYVPRELMRITILKHGYRNYSKI